MLLWVNVTDDDRQEQALRTQVTYDIHDENYVLVEAPDEIRTSFSGRRADLVSLNFNPPTIRVTVEEVTDTVMEVDVSLSAVTYETGTAIRPVGVSPSTLTLRFEPVARKRLPVYPVAQLEAADGFVILGRPIVEPDSVEASGPASQVESLASLSTEAVEAPPLRAPLQREVSVAVSPDLEDVSVDPTSVLVRVDVDSLVQRQMLVAIRVQGSAATEVRLSTDSLLVRLDGPRREVEAIGPGDISATVLINLAPSQPIAIPVQVTLPEGTQVAAVAVGPEVVAERREDTSAGEGTPD
jgi:YbbR domain-containing protein